MIDPMFSILLSKSMIGGGSGGSGEGSDTGIKQSTGFYAADDIAYGGDLPSTLETYELSYSGTFVAAYAIAGEEIVLMDTEVQEDKVIFSFYPDANDSFVFKVLYV